MIKIYIPISKGKTKTNIRGYWQGDKLYYDYIKIINTYTINNDVIDDIKKKYKQEAIFYIKDNIGYCYYNKKAD